MNNPGQSRVEETISALKQWPNSQAERYSDPAELLKDAMMIYGKFNDEQLIPDLLKLYDDCLQLVDVQIRHDIYQLLHELLMQGLISTNALFPILFRETNGSIVAAATVDYAQLALADENDELGSVNYIAYWITHLNLANKAAVLAGLINLGDKRIAVTLDELRKVMTIEDAATISELSNGYPTLAALEFWLRWLEDAPSKESSPMNWFEIVASNLGKLVLLKKIDYFTDLERHYGYKPYNNEDALSIFEKLDIREVGIRYADRLYALEAKEPPPKMMSLIVRLYGLAPKAQPSDQMRL
jgi:hypothetical protein